MWDQLKYDIQNSRLRELAIREDSPEGLEQLSFYLREVRFDFANATR